MTHMKALASPKTLKIHRKERSWVIRTSPGPHGTQEAVPVGVLLRDYLGIVDNKKEARYLLNNKGVLVDGKVISDEKYAIGLLDIIELPGAEKTYRMIVDNNSRLYPQEIDSADAKIKLCKLTGKTMIRGGKLQLNSYDGKNFVIDSKDSKKYVVGGTIVLKLPEQKIDSFIERSVGKFALVAKGRHSGKIGKIEKITESALNLKSLTTIDCDGEKVITNTDYIYIVGDKQSKI